MVSRQKRGYQRRFDMLLRNPLSATHDLDACWLWMELPAG